MPSYHVVHQASFTDGVTDFVEQHQADWVIVIPKDHGFFSSLFATSHTTRLAFHSQIPVLAIHG
jgi:nucleotide-binding universal stress UspA family protein